AFVDVQNREGAHAAVAHLIQLGHRRIGLINGQLQMEAALARRDGYKQALLEEGIAIDPELMVEGYYSQAAAYQATQQLLDLPDPPTAIFASSDTMAIGALNAIRDAALHVPEDIAAVGYDDLSLAVHSTPPLSSGQQPVDEMPAPAVRSVIETIVGTSSAPV